MAYEKVKIVDLQKEKISMPEVAKKYNKDKSVN